jgi:hypothetical protein
MRRRAPTAAVRLLKWNALLNHPLFSSPPHRDYARHKFVLEHLFTDIFPKWNRRSLSQEIWPRIKISKSSVHDWLAHWRRDSDWRPWNTEAHGRHHRVFSDEEEAEIVEEIVRNYIVPGRQFISATFRELVSQKLRSLGRDPATFQCSDNFIRAFKIRHQFSSRRFHMRRRQRIGDRADIEEWIHDTTELLATVDNRRVINCDETAWRVIPNGLLTWAPIGEENVSVCLNANEKDAITVVASVTAAHDKLPLFFIAKGRTERVEHSQLGDPQGHQTTHSPSGWTTAETFTAYLEWLRSFFSDAEPIHLILDCYSVHRSRESRELAAHLGIVLHFIPAGWTDELQPLDRYIFGALKAMCKRLFHQFCQAEDPAIRRRDAVSFLCQAWEDLATHVVEKSWGIYEDALGGPLDFGEDPEWEPPAPGDESFSEPEEEWLELQ